MGDEKELFQHDWYKILGLEPGVSIEIINRAARKLAIKYHPDKTSDANATDKFLLIQKAKSVLSDEGKKKIIDEHAMKSKKRQEYEIQRTAEMDSKRKKFRDDLERKMQEVTSKPSASSTELNPEKKQPDERKTSNKILQEMRNRSTQAMEESREMFYQQELTKQKNYEFYQTLLSSSSSAGHHFSTPLSQSNRLSNQIKVKWRKSILIESEESLKDLFGRYGIIEKIELSKNKKHSAKIRFSSQSVAQKVVEEFSSSNDYRVEFFSNSIHEEEEEMSQPLDQLNSKPDEKSSEIDFDLLFPRNRVRKRGYGEVNQSDQDNLEEESFFEKEERILQSLRDLQRKLEMKAEASGVILSNT